MRYIPVILHRDDMGSWVLMPKLLERMEKFLNEYTRDPGSSLPNVVKTAFGAGDTRALLLVIFDEDGNDVVGHMVATVEYNLGVAAGFIHQWQIDVTEKAVPEAVNGIITAWATGLGLESVMALAIDEKRARLFRKYGFDGTLVLTKRRI